MIALVPFLAFVGGLVCYLAAPPSSKGGEVGRLIMFAGLLVCLMVAAHEIVKV